MGGSNHTDRILCLSSQIPEASVSLGALDLPVTWFQMLRLKNSNVNGCWKTHDVFTLS